jgi:outer membrane protein TolC
MMPGFRVRALRAGALLAAALTAGAAPRAAVAQDGLPVVTLEEALRRAADLDPGYVRAVRTIGDAEWGRRSALAVFALPALTAQASLNRYSSPTFNLGTSALSDRIATAGLSATYILFNGGGRIADLRRARAELEAARADEVEARFQTALLTESDYHEVLARAELARVASERLRRAEQQLAVARARVISGAAVATDSLKLRLELDRAGVEKLRSDAALRVARLQLGRRVGEPGPVDAAPLDGPPAGGLSLTEAEAAAEAVETSPRVRSARARLEAAEARHAAIRGTYLPTVSLFGQLTAYDESFFPTATSRSLVGVQLTYPLWDGGRRETELSRAATERDVARAASRDEELAVRRDLVDAYQAFETARATSALAEDGVQVARENLRVQEDRYEQGATAILDLVTAQVDLTEAEASLVQARYQTRLAVAGVEAVLGRRLREH